MRVIAKSILQVEKIFIDDHRFFDFSYYKLSYTKFVDDIGSLSIEEFENLEKEIKSSLLTHSSGLLMEISHRNNLDLLNHLFSKYKDSNYVQLLKSEKLSSFDAELASAQSPVETRKTSYPYLYFFLKISSKEIAKATIDFIVENKLVDSLALLTVVLNLADSELFKYTLKKTQYRNKKKLLEGLGRIFRFLKPPLEKTNEITNLIDYFLNEISNVKKNSPDQDIFKILNLEKDSIIENIFLFSIFTLELENEQDLYAVFDKLLLFFNELDVSILDFYDRFFKSFRVDHFDESSYGSPCSEERVEHRIRNLNKVIDKFDLERIDFYLLHEKGQSDYIDSLAEFASLDLERNPRSKRALKEYFASLDKDPEKYAEELKLRFEKLIEIPDFLSVLLQTKELKAKLHKELSRFTKKKKRTI